MDPTPFNQRDLDPKAEESIAGWARELDDHPPVGLLVHADREACPANATELVHAAVRDHFGRRSEITGKRRGNGTGMRIFHTTVAR